ncbi:MAG: class I SAM-dependent methyltransferase [Pseudomonadota bacterium]|nr:class I SAM-dependent methyltransferase [Pseudomonadota bacterium]
MQLGNDPFKPDFWLTYAKERKKSFANKKITTAKKWDGLAGHYRKYEQDDDFKQDQQWIMAQLRLRRILQPEYNVIDVACGPGTHCFHFARQCKQVTALDVSPKMIDQLEAKKREQQAANIEVICSDFHHYKTKEKYDLVFVSMSPILNELSAVDRLLELSSRYLALVYWAGVRDNPLYNHCYKMIFNEPYVWDPLDIVAIFNYLYSLGFSPEISFQHARWKRHDTLENTLQHTLWHLEFYRPLSETEKGMVRDYLSPLADDQGMVYYETKVRKGFIILDQKAGIDDK